MSSPFASAATQLVANGYSAIPIQPSEKRPGAFNKGKWFLMRDWPRFCKQLPNEPELSLWKGWPEANIGIACGKGLLAFDIDRDDLVEPIKAVLPPALVGKRGRKGETIFYQADTSTIRSRGFKINRLGAMDLIADGKLTVVPPSIHPDTGEPYVWTTPRTLLDMRLDELPAIDEDHVAAVIKVLAAVGYDPAAQSRPEMHGGDRPIDTNRQDAAREFFRGLNDDALASLRVWVPRLGLQNIKAEGDHYRAAAEWRPSNSDKPTMRRTRHVSIHPKGIVDYGDGEKTYTPLDLVMAVRGLPQSQINEAAVWLGECLGYDFSPEIVLNRKRNAAEATLDVEEIEVVSENAPVDNARIVYDEENGVLAVLAETTIAPKGLRFAPGEVVSWKPGTALDGGPLTSKLLELALRMIEPDVIESPLATSAAWCLSLSWTIAVEALTNMPVPVDTSPSKIIGTVRSAIAQSAAYKALRTAEQKNRESGSGDAPTPFFFFEPYRLPNPASLPRRDFLYGGHYLRRALSGTIAPGGYGKSTLSLVEAISMVTGRDLLGHKPSRKFSVLVWNGEETLEELQRRVAGICLKYGITDAELGDRLMLASGRDTGLAIALTQATKSKVEIVRSVVDMLTQAIERSKADVVILDPLVSVHDAPENDNTAMQVVVTALRSIADGANCAVEIVHHTRKLADGKRVEIEDARGGSALSSATRSMRALNRMSKDEARKLGIKERERAALVCIGGADKANYQPQGGPVTWFKLESVGLGNARKLCEPQDHVGVPVPWTPPTPSASKDVEFEQVRSALTGAVLRRDIRAKDWIGIRLANCLGTDINIAREKQQLVDLVERWITEGKLRIVPGKDRQRRDVEMIEVVDETDGSADHDDAATERARLESLP